jgi:hypothetical protein
MTDGKRKIVNDIPVINRVWIHHSAGDKYNGKDPEYVFNELNRVGFGRGFAPYGYDFETGYSKEWGQNQHKHTGPGGTVISYAEYHYAIYEFAPEVLSADEPDLSDSNSKPREIIKPAEYRIVSLIDDPLWMDARSVGLQRLGESQANFILRSNIMNSDSLAFVFCWNAEIDKMPESMIEFFIGSFTRGKEFAWILDKNPGMDFKGHKDSGDQTACPGTSLYTFIPRIAREVILVHK